MHQTMPTNIANTNGTLTKSMRGPNVISNLLFRILAGTR